MTGLAYEYRKRIHIIQMVEKGLVIIEYTNLGSTSILEKAR
jgi:hypothetical protein